MRFIVALLVVVVVVVSSGDADCADGIEVGGMLDKVTSAFVVVLGILRAAQRGCRIRSDNDCEGWRRDCGDVFGLVVVDVDNTAKARNCRISKQNTRIQQR